TGTWRTRKRRPRIARTSWIRSRPTGRLGLGPRLAEAQAGPAELQPQRRSAEELLAGSRLAAVAGESGAGLDVERRDAEASPRVADLHGQARFQSLILPHAVLQVGL